MRKDFLEATQRWYEFVGREHHKDRDCHWYLGKEEQWSYGEEPKEEEWVLRHYGYVAHDQEFRGESEDSVVKQGIAFIDDFIADRLPTSSQS